MRKLPDTVYFPDVSSWIPDTRLELYQLLMVEQNLKCTVCGEYLAPDELMDVHEAIVTRGDVQGWPKRWRSIIFCLGNCVVVHRHCHGHSDREKTWVYKCSIYGKEEMQRWYDNLPFKVHPRRFR